MQKNRFSHTDHMTRLMPVATPVLLNSGYFFSPSIFVPKTSEGTPTTTGWFEVQVNGALVHSKKVRIIIQYNTSAKSRKGHDSFHRLHHFHLYQNPVEVTQ